MEPDKIVNLLNDLFKKDPSMVVSLLSATFPTNNEVLKDYDIKLSKNGYIEFGILSLLNKIIEHTGKRISFIYDVDINNTFVPKEFKLKNIKQ